jgi:hypothetical protein
MFLTWNLWFLATKYMTRKKNPINFRVQISPRVKTCIMPGFFPPISLLNISVYRLQPRFFIYDQAYFDLNLLITLIFFSIYKAYYISNQKQKKVDIFKFFKDEVNNVFDTNIIIYYSPLF